jgi:hypothetical protein
MRNPLRTCKDLWEREGMRAKAKGGWRYFWYCLTTGLLGGIWLAAWAAIFGYLGSNHNSEIDQINTSTFLAYGVALGLLTWFMLARLGKSGRPGGRI